MSVKLVAAVLLLCLSAMTSLGASLVMVPRHVEAVALPDLEALMPTEFGEWTQSALSSVIRPAEDIEEPGTVTLYRTYTNKLGQHVTLVLVYGAARGDAVRLHQPEVCYKAQGYDVRGVTESNVARLPVRRMVAEQLLRRDAITYWIRNGDDVSQTAAGQQWANLTDGIGEAQDTTLVRLSSPTVDAEQSYLLHEGFIKELMQALPADTRQLLAGAGEAAA
jgi:EpsI family protein